MDTSKILSDEHQHILKVISALDSEIQELESEKDIESDFFTKTIDFIRNYADKFHHAKEEDILFKEFNKCIKENPECVHCNPTEQMLVEHDEGRKFVKGMETRLNENDKIKVVRNARAYAELLKDHIYKEDNILYPMADETLNTKIQESMLKKFEEIDKERSVDKKKYLAFVKNLN